MATAEHIKQHFNDSIQTKITSADTLPEMIERAGELIVQTLLSNGKIFTCGNGGSACDAQHFSSEMLNRYLSERPSLPAVSLSSDVATLTAIANDYGYHEVFARQIKALGHENDILMVFSTSGNSKNIVEAVDTAQTRNMAVIAITGKDGGEVATLLTDRDIEIRVPSEVTARIQETHLLIIHCLCDMIDRTLFQTED